VTETGYRGPNRARGATRRPISADKVLGQNPGIAIKIRSQWNTGELASSYCDAIGAARVHNDHRSYANTATAAPLSPRDSQANRFIGAV
jgi:hypothetical protein